MVPVGCSQVYTQCVHLKFHKVIRMTLQFTYLNHKSLDEMLPIVKMLTDKDFHRENQALQMIRFQLLQFIIYPFLLPNDMVQWFATESTK